MHESSFATFVELSGVTSVPHTGGLSVYNDTFCRGIIEARACSVVLMRARACSVVVLKARGHYSGVQGIYSFSLAAFASRC